MTPLALTFTTLIAAMPKVAPAPIERDFKMDIPAEWMNLSHHVRNDSVNIGHDEIDLKWGPGSEFYQPLDTFEGDKSLRSKYGTFSAAYTSTNLTPGWSDFALRLRGELDYADYTDEFADAQVHNIGAKAGAYLEPKMARWNSGGVGVSLSALWQQWFSPESKLNLGQSGSGGGVHSSIEVRQELWNPKVKAVLSLAHYDYFIATPYRGEFIVRAGFGFTL